MSNHGASQSQTASTGLSANDAGTNPNVETSSARENNGAPNPPIGQNFDNSGIENHIITDVENLVELYRKSEQTKGSTLVSLVRAVESSISPPDTRRNAIINYTALLDDIEHQREVQSGRGTMVGTGGNTGGGQDGRPLPTPSGNPRLPIPDKPIDDAINDLISSIHAGSDGSQSGSESDRQDGESSGKRKRRLNEKSLPWYEDEKRARVSSDPSLDKNRRIIALFARDPSKVKHLIGSAQTAPHGFPSSEWDNIIRGSPVNLDVVLSSLHHVSAPKENRGRIGDSEISLGWSDPTRKVETSGQWTSAWNATAKAIRFAFRHREDELREYADYIEGLFSSIFVSDHSRVILYDKAVRAQVGGAQRLLLTDTGKFARLATAILMPNGIESQRSLSKKGNATSSKSSSSCNRFNSSQGCPNSKQECRYRHVCKKCNSQAHGSSSCSAPSTSTTSTSATS